MANQLAMDKSIAINNLRDAGYSERRIAQTLGVARGAVRRHLQPSGSTVPGRRPAPATTRRTSQIPKRDHWSANGKWALVLGIRGGKTLSLGKKTDDGLKEHWQRAYVDRIWPPHRAYVTNDGKYVVLRDVYQNIGHGKVIVILGEEGRILGSYKLKEFLSPKTKSCKRDGPSRHFGGASPRGFRLSTRTASLR